MAGDPLVHLRLAADLPDRRDRLRPVGSMTAIAVRPSGRMTRPALIVASLAAVVGLRWLATVQASAGAVAIGFVFGLGLLVVALGSGWRPVPERRSSIAIRAAGGAGLILLPI